jgi:hypothetical protein
MFHFVPAIRDFPDQLSTPILPNLGSHFLSLERSKPHFLHPQICTCIHDLIGLVRYAERCRSKEAQMSEDPSSKSEFFDNQNLYIEYRLLAFPFDYPDASTAQNFNPFQDCIRLTLLLFINTALWHGFPPSSAVIRSPLTALKCVLESPKLELVWQSSPVILLWILFMGANASNGQPERCWFVELLSVVLTYMDLKNDWVEVEERLRGCFYLEMV